MAKTDVVKIPVLFKMALVWHGFQVLSCFAQNNNDVFIPTPKVKTLEPRLTSTTPLPVTEKNLWGLRLWQVMALALFATIVLITFCCCLCDCRIPKTAYDSKNDPEEDSDCSDVEQLVSTPKQGRGEKASTNGFTPQKSQLRTTGHEMGKMNKGFDSEGEISSKSDNWRGTPRVAFSRQP
ncbi:hypothetical protein ABFA07_017137 [Porites harrisoni]